MRREPSLGVAMCTFNGERYLPVQLKSIAQQSRRPDLLLVCDDASQDRTYELLQTFAAEADFPVALFRNPVNLGYLRNFENAITRCDTEIVVLSDQDDFWQPYKLQVLADTFIAEGNVGALFSDARVVDDQLNDRGYSLLDAVKADVDERRAACTGKLFLPLLRRNIVCGATLAFRSVWKDRVLPFPDEVIHDEWIALVMAAYDTVRLIPEELIRYRQHGANEIGLPSPYRHLRLRTLLHRQSLWTKRQLALMQALQRRLLDLHAPISALDVLAGKIEHLRRRLDLPHASVARLRVVAEELINGHYSRYSSGWLSAAYDLVLPIR